MVGLSVATVRFVKVRRATNHLGVDTNLAKNFQEPLSDRRNLLGLMLPTLSIFLVIRPSRLRTYGGKPDTFREQVICNFKTLAITAAFREISEFNATIFSAEAIRHSIC